MRPLLQLLFALAISLGLQEAKAQWVVQQLPATQSLRGVYFADSLHGWISGIDGIFHTSDGGASWENQFQSGSPQISGTSSEICWARYNRDTLLRTTNAGRDWEKVSLRRFLSDSTATILKVSFFDSAHGWAAIYHNPPPCSMLRTSDGGATWLRITTPLGFFFRQMSFTDSLNGWIVDDGTYMYRTHDGGTTWDTLGFFVYARVMDLQFTDTLHGWMGLDSPGLSTTVKRTTDGGKTWLFKDTVFECSDYARVFFVDSLTGWTVYSSCVEGPGVVIHSIDGGVSWFRQYGFPPTSNFIGNKMYFTDKNHGWIAGEWGLVLHTTNGGVTKVKERDPGVIAGPASLAQNYPDPFNPSTHIDFTLPSRSTVTLKVVNILGQEIATPIDGLKMEKGMHTMEIDARGWVSGVYFYTLKARQGDGGQAGAFSATKKMMLMK